jgi:HTH-type transcriptional regulator/antitoxin HigA
MVSVKPIRTDEDHEAALARITELMDELSPPKGQIDDLDHPSRAELDVLTTMVTVYEEEHHPIGPAYPIAAIDFRLDQMGLARRDLVPIIGSRAKVAEVMSGKRDITMAMARALHQHLGIPADVLLREPGAGLPDDMPKVDWTRFPLRAMAKAGWIPDVPKLRDRAEELVGALMDRAGGRHYALQPFYRKNDNRRVNAKTDEYSLQAWCLCVVAKAHERNRDVGYGDGVVTPAFLREVATLSASDEGPRRARDFLANHGIAFEYVPHLPKTHLDGAALRLVDGMPVVGLTLRYDRIDNFWFTLLHELAHIGLHLDKCSGKAGFIDDHSLRSMETSSLEEEADRWAQDALIPPDIWEGGFALDTVSPMAVIDLAAEAEIHPAVVAGRVRHERGNYRLLSQFVGTGEVRKHFVEQSHQE